MAATVRLFTFSGLMTAPVASGSMRFSTDSVGLLKYPYLANETITANTSAAQSTAAALSTSSEAKVLLLQVQQGKAVHVEVNNPNRSTAATVDSPIVTGDQIIMFGSGWSVSLLEHEIS